MGATSSTDAAEFCAKYGHHYSAGMYGVVFVPSESDRDFIGKEVMCPSI